MALDIKKLTSEPAVFLLIFISLLLFRLTFNKELATDIITIFGFMLAGDFILWSIGSEVQSVSGNSAEALLWAGGSLVVLFLLYQFVNIIFRQSILPISASEAQLSQSVFQTVYQSMINFSGVTIDFSKFAAIKMYLFGFIIPLIETRVIARIYGMLGSLTNINISNFRDPRNLGLIALISFLFMWFHLQVRGINNNIDLLMTFLFGVVSLFLIGKFREIESAAELHVGWNSLALALGR